MNFLLPLCIECNFIDDFEDKDILCTSLQEAKEWAKGYGEESFSSLYVYDNEGEEIASSYFELMEMK
ncbi:hypothetical protein Arno18_42 [Pectobacterium phage Arno18]|jgi:hypothetical protein|uniref:Uncharacterized protein n=1 Tax=Pectobacterium phage Arno18 TaxID=2500578 RepID=A0A678ZJY5_9CAUD|nr:hypothetical protein Arno18_42 [Pectobacterium phage Arno18]